MSRSPSYSAWPAINAGALVDGYQEKPDRWVAEFLPEAAAPIGRERTRTDTDLISFDVELTFAEHATFLTFFHTTLFDGVLPFTFTHPRTQTIDTFAFVDAPTVKAVLPTRLVVSLQLRKIETGETLAVPSTVTWNPSDKSTAITLSNGDLDATRGASGSWSMVRATSGKSSGKWYWETEVHVGNADENQHGAADASANLENFLGSGGGAAGMRESDLLVSGWSSSVATAFGAGNCRTGDILMFAIDMSLGRMWFGQNGTWVSGNPVTNTSPSVTGVTGTVFPAVAMLQDGARIRLIVNNLNFSIPSGFSNIT